MPAPISLCELLPPAHILLLPENQNKKRTFEQATILLENISGLSRNELFRQFMQREQQGSTSIGFYGAIPHVHMEVKKPLCVLIRLKKPMQYDADNAPTSAVHTLFFLIAPEKETQLHLNLLAVFSLILADEEFMARLADCHDTEAVHQEVAAWEKRHPDSLNKIWEGQ